MKLLHTTFILFVSVLVAYAQPHYLSHPHEPHESPYQISWKQEMKFVVPASLLLGTSFYLKSKYDVLTDEEIANLNYLDINGFDQNSTFNNSASAKTLSDYFAFGTIALPLFFLTEKRCRLNTGHILTMWLEANFLTFSLTETAKHSVLRSRPYVYNPEIPNIEKQDVNSRLSFFSGHVAQTAVNSFFAAKVFSDYFPDSKLKPVVWSAAIIFPAVTAYGRVKAGRHFPTDVITGYAVGTAIGILIPEFHKVSENEEYKMSLASGGNGVLFKLTF